MKLKFCILAMLWSVGSVYAQAPTTIHPLNIGDKVPDIAFEHVYDPTTGCSVLVVPGDSIHINMDVHILDKSWLTFSGSNSFGNQQFYNLFYIPIQFYQPMINLWRNLPQTKDSLIPGMERYLEDLLLPFNQLLKAGKISTPYYTGIQKTLQLNLSAHLIRQLAYSSTPGIVALNTAFRNLIIESLISRVEPEDVKLRGLFHADLFLEQYYRYLAMKRERLKSVDELNLKDTALKIDKLLAHLVQIEKGPVQESLWAGYLAGIFRMAIGYPYTKEALEQYGFIFPESKYIPLLREAYTEHIQFKSKERVALQPVTILDSSGNCHDTKVEAVLWQIIGILTWRI